MCGIAGIALRDAGARPDRELLGRMVDTLVHRGPDDGTLHLEGPFGLGFRRLAIIDPEGGRQPLFNEERDVAVVMNGELYNFRELRAELVAKGHAFRTGSDAEVLVHLYEEHGDELLERLVGMFAFALVDRRGGRARMLLARDRLGIKPLYYADTGQGLAFASECKAILATGWTRRALRPEALLDYLVQGYVGGEHAAWEGIERLPPAHFAVVEPGVAPRVERYWDLPTDGLRGPAEPGEILEWLDRVVEDRLVADVPLGAFLSGGIDSTAVVTSMHARSAEPPVVCSVGFRERSHDELAIAQATARRLGATQHTRVLDPDPTLAVETLPWFYDEPLADPSTVPTYLVSATAREHVVVALSGDGGDETFAGYRRYVHDVAENRLRQRVGAAGRAAARAVGQVYPRLDWAPRFLARAHVPDERRRRPGACVLPQRDTARAGRGAVAPGSGRRCATRGARPLRGLPPALRAAGGARPALPRPVRRLPHLLAGPDPGEGRSRLHGGLAGGARAHPRPPLRRALRAAPGRGEGAGRPRQARVP